MEGFTSEEQKRLNLSRQKNDRELKKGGARIGRNGRLDITHGQLKDAVVEMRLSELQKREGVITTSVNENFEIGETRVFSIDEIIHVIARFEKLDPRYLSALEYVTNTEGEIISAGVRLKDEIAYNKFGCSMTYIYEIKGFSKSDKYPSTAPTTSIGKLFQNADSNELMARQETEMEYAETEVEKKLAEEAIVMGNDGTIAENFLEFDGIEWRKVEEKV